MIMNILLNQIYLKIFGKKQQKDMILMLLQNQVILQFKMIYIQKVDVILKELYLKIFLYNMKKWIIKMNIQQNNQ